MIFSALTFTNEDKNLIAIAIHSGTKYYDCSEVFFNKAASIVEDYSGGRIKLIAPFLNWSKAEIYVYCKKQSIPIKLTHSCESGDIAPCGMCLSCVDRKAFDVS